MKYAAKQYAQALLEAIESARPQDESTVLDNFVKVLAENNDLRLFDEISSEFHKLDLARKGIKQAQITSAHPLNKQNEQEIVDQLNRLVNGKVEVKKQIDEQLIGGVIIRMDDQILDASVKNNLEQLKKELSN
ncbi:MAG: ATP synthase F1 subunit delta [Candidatus Doudnabacteria bacterium]